MRKRKVADVGFNGIVVDIDLRNSFDFASYMGAQTFHIHSFAISMKIVCDNIIRRIQIADIPTPLNATLVKSRSNESLSGHGVTKAQCKKRNCRYCSIKGAKTVHNVRRICL